MKRSLSIFLVLTFVSSVWPDVRPSVPEGVTYRFIDDARLAEIKEFLIAQFARGDSGVAELFSEECTCAPGYWRLVENSGMVAPQLRNFSIPNKRSSKTYNLDGAHLEDRRDLDVLSRKVAADVGKSPIPRRLSTKEIARLWIVIPFDIEEPVFVLDGGPSIKLVVCLKSTHSGWRVWWIDALDEYDYGK